MSRETLEWLNANTLIGYTDEHHNAWHWDGVSDNHFTGPVPIDMARNLLDIPVAACDVYVDTGHESGQPAPAENFKAITNLDNEYVYQIASPRYLIHEYTEWLIDEVGALLDASAGDLTIGSAGLLRMGGQAWVQVRPPSTVTIGGDEQLPWILATTSHDGTLVTQYKAQRQRVVCDNTLAVGLTERGNEYRIRHTSNSKVKLGEAREALAVMYAQQDEFDREVERLMNTPFSNDQWREINGILVPPVDPVVEHVDDGSQNGTMKVTNTRAINNRDKVIDELDDLWFNDNRVGDFTGTVWGAKQAHNTWFHWNRTHGTNGNKQLLKARQIQSTVSGDTDTYDRKVEGAINTVLVGA